MVEGCVRAGGKKVKLSIILAFEGNGFYRITCQYPSISRVIGLLAGSQRARLTGSPIEGDPVRHTVDTCFCVTRNACGSLNSGLDSTVKFAIMILISMRPQLKITERFTREACLNFITGHGTLLMRWRWLSPLINYTIYYIAGGKQLDQ